MINVLLVSIAFPPKNDPESLQTLKYYRHLQKEDLNIDVVTSSNPTLWMNYDVEMAIELKEPRQLVEIRITEPRLLSIAIGKYFRFLQRPDSRMGFYLQWRKVVKTLRTKPDIIYSRSFPLSSTLMALKLKRKFGVPWILHLSDPWAESPLFRFTGLMKKYHDKIEGKCFREADVISFTSTETINLYTAKYPELAGKFEFFPNVFDQGDLPDENQTTLPHEKFRIVYTGSLTGTRHIRYIKDAIELLQQQFPSELENMEFIIAGHMDRSIHAMTSRGIPSLNYLGSLSFNAAKKLQNSADVLLVIDFLFEKDSEAVYLPSKLLDYILAKKTIIGITNINSATYNLVEDKYGRCFAHNDAAGIAKQIHQYYSDWKDGLLNIHSAPPDNSYSAAYNAKRLYSTIKKLCKK